KLERGRRPQGADQALRCVWPHRPGHIEGASQAVHGAVLMTATRHAFDPHDIGDLPPVIAVFPLTGALLLPRAELPLNIFEPRYLDLVRDSLSRGRMFGMVQPSVSRGANGEAPLYDMGCLG